MIWRISGRRPFQELARRGRRARTPALWCNFVDDPAASPLRVAFSVGRAVGPATRRNRLRRRLRAIIVADAPSAGVESGWLLVGARPTATELTFEALRAEVGVLLAGISPAGRS